MPEIVFLFNISPAPICTLLHAYFSACILVHKWDAINSGFKSQIFSGALLNSTAKFVVNSVEALSASSFV